MARRALRLESLESRRVLAGVILNEVFVNPIGSDGPFEYIEVKGIPGATIPNGTFFVSIEGDSGAVGMADVVIDLSGQTMGSNGLLVIKATVGGFTIPAETTVVTDEIFEASGGILENGTNTFALIFSPNSPIIQGTDLETTGDNVLDLPSGASVIDSVGWTDGGAGDVVFGAAVLSQFAGTPDAATRFLHDNRTNTEGGWYWGDLAGTNANPTYATNASNRSANFPVGGQVTPGQLNVPGGPNNAPVAVADFYNAEPNVLLTTNAGSGVLINDSDPDGVNSLLSVVLITSPSNATSFVMNLDGSFSYLNNGTLGTDSFTYQATDLNLFSNIVTVTIEVAVSTNVAPVITIPTGTVGYVEDGPASIIAGTATLVDSDSANFAGGSLEVTIVSNLESTDLLEVRNEGVGSGQVSVNGANVSYEGNVIGILTGGGNGTPLRIDLNSAATPVATEALMRNITFRTLSDAPSNLDRVVQFVVTDGDGGPEFGVSNAASTIVTVASSNDDPSIVSTRSNVFYVASGPAMTLDGLLGLTDGDLVNFDAGVLTAAISNGLQSGDSLLIRSSGTGPGQISVAADVVSFEGNAIGTVSGGTNGTPLLVTFNAKANVDAVQAAARAVAFATTSTRLASAARTISLSLTDGDGGTSNSLSYSVNQSQTRRFGFQEGVDNGQGIYVGAADIQLAENQPDTPLPAGGNPTTEGLLVDFDGGFANSQVLLRFDDVFGTGAGQIPVGSTIVSARLVVATLNGGDGGTLHRMLTSWDANTETWNSFGNGVAPRNTTPAVQADDIEARAAFESQIGNANGNSDPSAIPTIIGVTADVQAWANGSVNFGWLMQGWTGRPDGWAFMASESTDPTLRPKLEVEWLPAGFSSSSFRQGENGYTGSVDVALQEANPTVNVSTGATLNVDYNDAGATNNSHVLIRFDDILGANAGQIPAGALVHSAALMLAATGSNAQGDGGTFHAMLQPFDATTVTWNTFGPGAPGVGGGVTPDGVEANVTPSTSAGNASLNPNAEAGFHAYDITSDVQAWTNGSLANNGLAILPWINGSDGWVFGSSENTTIANRPQLRVFFTPVGATVSPTSGLVTTEAGGTANFSLVLNTPPTADVTIGLTSSNPNEGIPSVSSVTFTTANWDIPQVVIVTGVSDGVTDGDVAYQIITAAAISSDVNYSGLDFADVSLVNNDVTTLATPSLSITSGNLVYNAEAYVPTASISGNNAPLPTIAFEFYSDAEGTNVIAAPKNVGTYYVRAFSDANAGNNAAQSDIASFDITAKELVGSVTVANKIVDGTTDATILTRSLTGVIGTETVSYVGGTAAFDTAAVGTNKAVTVTGLSLTGADAGNYSVNTTAGAVADVIAEGIVQTRGVRYLGATGSSASTSLATDKVALLPGGTSGFTNYTNYSRGLNGVVVDIADLPASTTPEQLLASLQLAQWNGIAAGGFTALPPAAIPAVTITSGTGAGGSARVQIAFPDNTLQNTWLRVTVVAGLTTALRNNDVFYFGNVIGEFNAGNTSTRLRVNATDTGAVRSNQSPGANSASVTNIYDVNRDGRVNATDTALVRSNQQASGIVAPITVPGGAATASSAPVLPPVKGAPAPLAGASTTSSFAGSSTLPLASGSVTVGPSLGGASSLVGAVAVEMPSSAKRASVDLLAESATKSNESADPKLESVDSYFASIWKNV